MQIYTKLTDIRDKMNAFCPLSKEEVESIEKDKKYDHIWSSNAMKEVLYPSIKLLLY